MHTEQVKEVVKGMAHNTLNGSATSAAQSQYGSASVSITSATDATMSG